MTAYFKDGVSSNSNLLLFNIDLELKILKRLMNDLKDERVY